MEPNYRTKAASVKANIYSVRQLQADAKRGALPDWLVDLRVDPRNSVTFSDDYISIRYVQPDGSRRVVAAPSWMYLARLESGWLRVLVPTEFRTLWEPITPAYE